MLFDRKRFIQAEMEMGKSRISKRREAEAAETLEKTNPKKKKKPAAKKTTRKKTSTSRSRRVKDVPPRRRLVWVVYSSTMREEGRFLYHERKKAEEKLKQLLAKGKRRYFIQPIKELLDSNGAPLSDEPVAVKKPEKKPAPKAADGDAGKRKKSEKSGK